jgi:hypothetical protein
VVRRLAIVFLALGMLVAATPTLAAERTVLAELFGATW